MRKLAHVPVQTWRGWDPSGLFGRRFSALDGFKTLIETISLILAVCLILPCLAPLMLQCIKTIMEAIIATHVMMLWKYKPLNQGDALWPWVGPSIKRGNNVARKGRPEKKQTGCVLTTR
jgi:hypothetical protein